MSSLASLVASTSVIHDATAAFARAALPGLGVVRVHGDEARSFLHAQVTADLKRLAPGRGGPAAWCSPKGRVLFLFDVLNAGEAGWLLVVPVSEISALVKRLRMYVLRAKVLVEDLGDAWGVMGLAGSALPDALGAPGIALADGETWLWRMTDTPALGYALGPQGALIARWHAGTAPIVDAARWESFEIDAARPRIATPCGERFLPQELDLERLQGVHFDKGCYPGQEIVARLKYRGQVKAGLHRAYTSGPVAVGDKLYRADSGASVGDVLRVAPLGAGSRVLAVLDFGAATEALHLRDAQGPRVTLDA